MCWAKLFDENGLGGSVKERRAIAERWHQLDAWPDFAAGLRRLRSRRICVSFTILSLSLVIDVSRRNGIDWDAVIPCEMLRVYKPLPDAYRRAAALLAVEPREILMVACHNFDLDAARGVGYRTAFVRRPDEWGPASPPDPVPNPATDIVVDGFANSPTTSAPEGSAGSGFNPCSHPQGVCVTQLWVMRPRHLAMPW
jgi:2-haloacid dehalogenase